MNLPDPRKMTDGEISRLEHRLAAWLQAAEAIVQARGLRQLRQNTTARLYDIDAAQRLRAAGVLDAPYGWESVEGETPIEGLKLAGLLAG